MMDGCAGNTAVGIVSRLTISFSKNPKILTAFLIVIIFLLMTLTELILLSYISPSPGNNTNDG